MKYECGPKWDRRVITVDPKEGDAILMSGGIDSFVLYHLLDNPIAFNITRADGIDNAPHIKQLIGKDPISIEDGFADDPDVLSTNRIPDGVTKIIARYKPAQLYTGTNIIPHTEYFPEFNSSGKPYRQWRPERDPARVISPFAHLYKYHIIDLANQIGLDLSDTQTCALETTTHCGTCWPCKEKLWGYAQLNL